MLTYADDKQAALEREATKLAAAAAAAAGSPIFLALLVQKYEY
jgi:hypothetical protein